MDLKELSRSGAAKQIINLLKETEDKLADIRFQPEMSLETRTEVIKVFHNEVVLRVQRAFGFRTKEENKDDKKELDAYN